MLCYPKEIGAVTLEKQYRSNNMVLKHYNFIWDTINWFFKHDSYKLEQIDWCGQAFVMQRLY